MLDVEDALLELPEVTGATVVEEAIVELEYDSVVEVHDESVEDALQYVVDAEEDVADPDVLATETAVMVVPTLVVSDNSAA